MGDAGVIGSTGVYLLILGMLMVAVGGVGIFANMKNMWMVLFIIELINVAIFLVLYCLIIIVVMTATGIRDPVREAAIETWDVTLPTLTIDGSNPDDADPDQVATYCGTSTYGTDCTTYYDTAVISETCQFGPGYSAMEILNNCSKLLDPVDVMSDCPTCSGLNTGCAAILPVCQACEEECFEATITDVKANLEPASAFVFFLSLYFTVTIVWNNVMVANEDWEGTPQLVGLTLNGILLGLSFVFFIVGTIGLSNANDACPDAADGCSPDSMVYLVVLGGFTLVVAGLACGGTQLGNSTMVTMATMIMVVLAIFMVLFAIVLGMSTGIVMDDMNHYYDTQYPKLRKAFEKADNSYCQMTKEQCQDMVAGGYGHTIPVQSDGEQVEVDWGTGLELQSMTFESVWKQMYAEAAAAAAETDDTGFNTAPAWLQDCATTGICIYCGDLFTNVETVPQNAYDASCETAGVGSGCEGQPCPTLGVDGCVSQAANFEWARGLVGANSTGDLEPVPSDTMGSTLESLAVGESFTEDSLKCQGSYTVDQELDDANDADGSVDTNPLCLGVFTLDNEEFPGLYNKRCKGMNMGEMTPLVSSATQDSPCELSDSVTLDVVSSDDWTADVNDYTRFNIPAKEAMPYCEEAIVEYVQDDRFCPDYDEMSQNQRNSYFSNCDSCDNPFAPFTFSFAGPETGYRQCLNFALGHFMDRCAVDGSASCLTAIQSGNNADILINAAYADGSSFCGYSDQGCKSKIKYDMENSMGTVAVFGCVFLFFFACIMYCTMEAIKVYKAGGELKSEKSDEIEDDEEGEE